MIVLLGFVFPPHTHTSLQVPKFKNEEKLSKKKKKKLFSVHLRPPTAPRGFQLLWGHWQQLPPEVPSGGEGRSVSRCLPGAAVASSAP